MKSKGALAIQLKLLDEEKTKGVDWLYVKGIQSTSSVSYSTKGKRNQKGEPRKQK